MKVLVLGGNRFFGKKLVRKLIERGDRVTVLNRGSRPDDFGEHVTRIRCDRKDAKDLRLAVGSDDWDVVYDQVCYDADTAETAVKIFSGKVGHYIFTSTRSVYDYGSDMREESFDPYTFKFSKRETYDSNYGVAKRQAEWAFFQDKSFPAVAVRFPIVLGTDDYTGRLEFHIERVAAQRPIYFPNPTALTNYIHSDDAAKVLLELGAMNVRGPVNACSPDTISIEGTMKLIEDELQAHTVYANNPREGDPSPFGIEAHCYVNTDKLQKLGIKPRSLGEWLPKLIRDLSPGR